MHNSKLNSMHALGQSIRLDFIDRNFIHSGGLKEIIDHDGIRGITSNPAIYISGLEDRLNQNLPIDSISSVASFFIGRIDSVVDPELEIRKM